MHKLNYLKAVLKSDTVFSVPWAITAFSIIQEAPDEWKKDPYPYRIVQTPIMHYFVDPETKELVPLEGSTPGNPIFRFKERVVLLPGDVDNVFKETVTTIGNAIYNRVVIVAAVGKKIPFVTGRVDTVKIENNIAKILQDTPSKDKIREDDVIYVDEYQKFANATFDLANYSQLCTWGLTKKAVLAPPGINEFKQKQFEENKERLHDPAIAAKIDAALVKYDADYLAGDPAMNFLLSGKSKDIVRKKLFLAYGAERSLTESNDVEYISRSLEQGWDINKFPAMNNALRSGVFDRGSETQLGGVKFKEILRSTANIRVLEGDCGSQVGIPVRIEKDTLKHIVKFSLVTEAGPVFIKDEEEAGKYLGKVVQKRSMMYCLSEGNTYCGVCAGYNLASNPFATSMAAAGYGQQFLAMFMSAMHGKTLSTVKFDFRKAFS